MAPPGITVRLTKESDATGTVHVLPYCGQNFRDLKLQCLQQRRLFTDAYFDARPESLGYSELGPGSAATKKLVWKRPKDICNPRTPRFIQGGTTRFDVCQGGYLGDCWFLAAAASLTLRPHLLRRVVPPDQSFDSEDYAGIFHFQFWQYGQWVDVVVDDRLPTVDGELFFVRSAERDEFWMPLLEKAYAKLSGSYEAMIGGFMNEAFVDFTGGIGETIFLKAPNRGLFKLIRAALSRRSLMGAFIQVGNFQDREAQTPEGLVKGHAYSITGTHKLKLEGETVRLLRLRNPWGFIEWKGRWSDISPLWSKLDPVLQTKLCANREDGEFWMQLVDFIRYFDALEICHLNPADVLEKEETPSLWNVNCIQGHWVRGHTSGGRQTLYPWDTFWMNPQYHVSLLEPDEDERKKQQRKERQVQDPTCTLLVSLMQKDQRRSRWRGKDFLLISLDIFQVPKQYLELKTTVQRRQMLPKLKAVCLPVYGHCRDITGHLQLSPGDYVIIPSTLKPMEEASFTLRIFTENKHQFLEIDDEISMDEKALQVMASPRTGLDQTLEKTFREWAGQDQQVGTMELQGLLNRTMSTLSQMKMVDFSMEDCLKITRCFSDSGTGRLTLLEFKQVWTKIEELEGIFFKYDLDRSGTMNTHEMQLALSAAGFHLNKQTTEVLLKKYSNPWLQIDFRRFVSFMVHLEHVFRQCKLRDFNGDGLIYMTEKEWMELFTSG